MTPTLRDVLVYIRFRHADAASISEARAMMTAYLADWRSALMSGAQITDVHWTLEKIFTAGSTTRYQLTLLSLDKGEDLSWSSILAMKRQPADTFSEEQRSALDFVVEVAQRKDFSDFLRLVSSTYPVLTQEDVDVPLNLVALAAKYKTMASREAR